MGHATVVMFSPEDLRIVRDGPGGPADALWICSSARSAPAIVRALKTYLSVLESRNALLRQDNASQGVSDFANQLDAWDEQLSQRRACLSSAARRWFLQELSRKFQPGIRRHMPRTPDEPFSLSFTSAH